MYVVNLVHRTGCYFLKIEETHKVKKKIYQTDKENTVQMDTSGCVVKTFNIEVIQCNTVHRTMK